MMMSGKLKKGGNKKDFRMPFCNSVCRTLRFHLGTICVGAFIIALVQIIRAIMAYIDQQTKSWQNKNKCYRVMFKILHLCLCLLEKCLKFITKNAYIMVAMRGKAFCESCCDAFKLLLTNIVQFAIVGIFSKVVVFFGKLVICCSTMVCIYAWIKIDPTFTDSESELYVKNSWIPTVLTFGLAWAVSSSFLYIYDLAIATILMCFCEDYRYHNVGDKDKVQDHDEVFMPNSLRRIVLPPESRKILNHPMTYEEVRVYSAHVHDIKPPHRVGETSCGKNAKNAQVTPENANYNVAKPPARLKTTDYEGDAAKAKTEQITKKHEEQTAEEKRIIEAEKKAKHDKLEAKLSKLEAKKKSK
jgi:hypothetical protein